MGGTTAKAGLIERGVPRVTNEMEVARTDRFARGSGLPLQVPSVDLIEIGAGGGSIARLDRLGRLHVGPESAGADPGPACYPGRDAAAQATAVPTVTDADLTLGYLGPTSFLGGRMTLDSAAASAAIERDVAGPLGVTVPEAAWRIHCGVNEAMAARWRSKNSRSTST